MSKENILTPKSLTHEAISRLAHRDVMAIHIENYYDPAVAKKISSKLCESSLYGKYENAPNIGRVGQAYFEGLSSESSAEKYRKNSRDWLTQLRSDCSPYILPIDRFRLEIDEAWDRGAKLGNLHLKKNLKAFAGLVRVFSQGSGTEIHLDNLGWDLEKIDKANTEVMIQLAVNVYLDLPKSGGEVKLWRISPDKKEYEKYRNEGSYGVNGKNFPNPDLIFKPKLGDLWMFRASELHQVVEAGKGRRVTQSCFVGFRGDDDYLIVWS